MNKKVLVSGALMSMLLSYCLGLVTYRNGWFPLSFYRGFVQLENSSSSFGCPTTQDRYETVLGELHLHADFTDLGILVGDSFIEFVYDPRPYGLQGWIDVALSGQTTQCLLQEIGRYTVLQPAEALLYISGNDADRGLSLNVIFKNYEFITNEFLQLGISLTLHKIHYGLDEIRPRSLVVGVNSFTNRIDGERQITVIQTRDSFRYEDLSEALETSIDGEHLNHRGYAIWMESLSEQLRSVEAGTTR